jgi:hypothetical protein
MKKYNSIIKGFTKTIKKLESLASYNVKIADINSTKIAELEVDNKALNAESVMAATTARKLAELIGG